MVTEVTVRPTTSLSRPDKPVFGVYTPGDRDDITAGEVLSGLNPLHHIPFVSQLYGAEQGPTTAAVSVGKLIGGALLGGPIGFLASLANVIYEQETGSTMVAAASAALTGEPTTQVAQARATGPVELASMRGISTPTQEILPPESAASANQQISAAVAQDQAIAAQMQVANAMGALTNPLSQQDQDVLSLFGAEQQSAHRSYRQAQLRPYLKDVTTSQVL